MTKDEVQRSRWTFYEVVTFHSLPMIDSVLFRSPCKGAAESYT